MVVTIAIRAYLKLGFFGGVTGANYVEGEATENKHTSQHVYFLRNFTVAEHGVGFGSHSE